MNTCINSYTKNKSCPLFAVNILAPIGAEYIKPHGDTGMFCSTHQLQQTSVSVHLMRTGEVEKILLCYAKKNKVLEKYLTGEVLDKYNSSTDYA